MKNLSKLVVAAFLAVQSASFLSCNNDKIEQLEYQIEQDSIIHAEAVKEDSTRYAQLKESYDKKDSLVNDYEEQIKILKPKAEKSQKTINYLYSKINKLKKEKKELSIEIEEYKKLEESYYELKADYQLEKDKLRSINRQKEIKKEKEAKKWKAASKPWNYSNEKHPPRYSKMNGHLVEFKENNGVNMQAYAKFRDGTIVDLKRFNQGFKGASFYLPEARFPEGSFVIYAVDKDGNQSKEYKINALSDYVSKKRLKEVPKEEY